jgi:DNA-binding GntR family transcriptional regulator
MLDRGRKQPGQKIPEQELCVRFGVSRTPMREALKVLAAEGLLQLLPNRGAIVARISPEEIEELFPIMGSLEALAGELACARMSDRRIAEVRAMHDRMVRHFERNEYLPYAKLNKAIHDSFFEAAGNAALTTLYNTLMVRIHSVRFVARKSPARWQEAIDDHVKMIEALEARNGDRLSALLREHLRHKVGMVHESLAALDAEAAE